MADSGHSNVNFEISLLSVCFRPKADILYILYMNKAIIILIILSSSNSLFAQGDVGAGVFAYPTAGQSTEQTQTDTFQCHNWAVTETGFDPTLNYTPQQVPDYAPPPSSGGSADRTTGQNAGRGAARGAVLGTITGSTARGAIIGTATGILFGKKKRNDKKKEEERWQQHHKEQQQQQLQEIEQYVQTGTGNYRRAYGACMTARNYKVQ